MRKIAALLCCLCMGIVAFSDAARADLAQDILELTGARTKIVWVHCVQGRPKGWDAVTADYELKGFDTDEGTARVILPGPAC